MEALRALETEHFEILNTCGSQSGSQMVRRWSNGTNEVAWYQSGIHRYD
jgi:hypothetical protein